MGRVWVGGWGQVSAVKSSGSSPACIGGVQKSLIDAVSFSNRTTKVVGSLCCK